MIRVDWLFVAVLAISTVLLQSCATTPAPGEADAQAPRSGLPASGGEARADDAESGTPGRSEPLPSPDAATLALLQQSERAAEGGSLSDALVYAERAVRIDPRRPDLWTRLAALELADGNPETAVQYANKALSLARSQPDRQRDAWLVIADATEALGDPQTAREIRERWRTGRG